MNITDLHNSIIVSDKDYFSLLYQNKNEYPSLSFKLMDTSEVIDSLSFAYKENPLPYLVYEKKMDYSTAKKYMKILRVAERSKSEKLTQLYNELHDRFLEEDDLADITFKDKKIYLLEMQEDKEIHALFKRKHLSTIDIELKDLNIFPLHDEESLKSEVPICYFPNRFQQYFYLFSKLRKEYLLDEKKKKTIKVLISDEKEEFYIRTVSKLFSLSIGYNPSLTYLSLPSVKDKIRNIYDTKTFSFTDDEKKNPELSSLIDVIDEYHLASLDFDFAYSNLLEIVSSMKVKTEENGFDSIFTTRFDLDKNKEIYVMDFTYDAFYKEYQNKSVFSDEQLKELSCNTSYENTLLDKRKKKNYLFYQNIRLLSRVTQHLSDHIFDSQFIADYHLSSSIQKVDITKPEYFDGSFTEESKKIYLSYQLDKQFVTEPYQEFNSYDNSFTGIEGEMITNPVFSISKIEQYSSCPFRYLMQKIIPALNEDKQRMYFGTLLHTFMENIYHPDFDVEETLQRGKEKFVEILEDNNERFDERQEVFYSIVEHWMRLILRFLENENHEMAHADIIKDNHDYEIPINFSIQDSSGKEYPFFGKVDKVLTTKVLTTGNYYYTIIDYKSGKEEFDDMQCFLGKSIQLPLYAYAILNNPSLVKIDTDVIPSFAGFGIQHVYPSSFKAAFAESGDDTMKSGAVIKYLTTKGCLWDDDDYLTSLNTEFVRKNVKKNGKETTVTENPPSFFDFKMVQNDDGSYSLHKKTKTAEYYHPLNDIIQESIDISLNVIHAMEKNEYPIAPKQSNLKDMDTSDLVCKNCLYKDVCYHRAHDAYPTGTLIKEHTKPYIVKGEKKK